MRGNDKGDEKDGIAGVVWISLCVRPGCAVSVALELTRMRHLKLFISKFRARICGRPSYFYPLSSNFALRH